MNANQICTFAPREFISRLVSHDAGKEVFYENAKLPLISWPNGHWCIEVNLFLRHLFYQGYSVRGNGGTLATYAFYLSHLIKYCYRNGKNFYAMSDADFTAALSWLGSTNYRKDGDREVRRTLTVGKIASVWLEFLHFVGTEYHNDPRFVAADGIIKGQKKSIKKFTSNQFEYFTTVWTHAAIPEPEPENVRLPVSESVFEKLKAAIEATSNDVFLRERRRVTLTLLDILGLRRMELVLLRVSDVKKCLSEYEASLHSGNVNAVAHLTFRAVKKKKGAVYPERSVPIDPISLNYLVSYVRERRRHLQSLGIFAEAENARLIINAKSGKGLLPNTITQEFHMLAKFAGIVGQCCPHMMRHRFITRAFVKLVIAEGIASKDEFRQKILDDQTIKQKVKEIAGHGSVKSLEVYINLAVDEVSELKKTMKAVNSQNLFEALNNAMNRAYADIQHGQSPSKTLSNLLEALKFGISALSAQ